MRVLLTNDDGIHAPGLEILEEIAAGLSDDVWIVAPEYEQSGASRSLSLTEPLRMRELSPKRFAVQGTPTDCVIMALRHVMEVPPDLVLSGVNRGQNVADDVQYSGTIAGAQEGTLLGIPSMALSQSYGWGSRSKLHWECAAQHGTDTVKHIYDHGIPPGAVINVNFPDCPPDQVQGLEVTRQGKRDQNLLYIDERQDGRGFPYYWLAFDRKDSDPRDGTDLRALIENRISVTPLLQNLTDNDALKQLSDLTG